MHMHMHVCVCTQTIGIKQEVFLPTTKPVPPNPSPCAPEPGGS